MVRRKMHSKLLLVGALCAVSVLAIASSMYALRARDSAIRGWADASDVRQENAALVASNDGLRLLVQETASLKRLIVDHFGQATQDKARLSTQYNTALVASNDGLRLIAQETASLKQLIVDQLVQATQDKARQRAQYDELASSAQARAEGLVRELELSQQLARQKFEQATQETDAVQKAFDRLGTQYDQLIASSQSAETVLRQDAEKLRSKIGELESAERLAVAQITLYANENNGLLEGSRVLKSYHLSLKDEISKLVGIKSTDTHRQIAEKLTLQLYKSASFSGVEKIESYSLPQQYYQTLTGKGLQDCSTLSATLVWLLGLFDIDARSVSFAAENYFTLPAGDTHTLVEFVDAARIVAIDPTFNAEYQCGSSSDAINAREMFECNRVGKLRHSYIGPNRVRLTIEDYYAPLSDLLYAIDARGGLSDVFYQYEYPQGGWVEKRRSQLAQSEK